MKIVSIVLLFAFPMSAVAEECSVKPDRACVEGRRILGDRLISLEAFAHREARDFTSEGLCYVKNAGFSGVFLNGGSGFGPDQIPLELSCETDTIPGLAPYTCRANLKELQTRKTLLDAEGLDAWWCLWGVVGPYERSIATTYNDYSNFDRRVKLEMKAERLRHPDYFGARAGDLLSCRGTNPMCLSHPKVRQFYHEVMRKAVATYRLKGLVMLPGDCDMECCDDTCARCKASGVDGCGRMIALANDLMVAGRETNPSFSLYWCVWSSGFSHADRLFRELDPRIGIVMPYSDRVAEKRVAGTISYNQPWMNVGKMGPHFKQVIEQAQSRDRPIMALGEMAQSELWDPLHNIPLPETVLSVLRGVRSLPGNAGFMDFWGMRGPYISHANLATLRAFMDDPDATDDKVLDRAALSHYGIAHADAETVALARSAWAAFAAAEKKSSLVAWPQRFNYAIGRDRARGKLYMPLIPRFLKGFTKKWCYTETIRSIADFQNFMETARSDRDRFGGAADTFARLSATLAKKGCSGSSVAFSESVNIRLVGELYGSIARTMAAARFYEAGDSVALKALIDEEIAARERELALSQKLDNRSGINAILVEEDIQNMRLYFSVDTFPEAPEEIFSLTDSPFKM